MKTHVRAVTFSNDTGLNLFGILHEPAIRRQSSGVILLSPGIKSRVAPHRMYNKMADMLVDLGFPVLRFDFHGLGDSEGTLADRVLPDLYGAIQVGRYVGDTRRAIDWMRTNCQVDRVILGGLCGGAITGVLAAAGHPHVSGLFGLGLPVIVDGSHVDQTQNMTIGQLNGIRTKYLNKLLRASSWARVLTMKTDFRLLFKSLLRPMQKRQVGAQRGEAVQPAGLGPRSNTNPHFPKALSRVLDQACPVLLLFSESDRLYAEFQEKFLVEHRAMVERQQHLIDIHVVPEANHVFTFTQWQEAMTDLLRAWLRRRYDLADAPGTDPHLASVVPADCGTLVAP